jgi:hypothetical protein
VNGIVYAPQVLAAVAALLPETALAARHQAVVNELIGHKPTTYRRAAESLARRAAEVAAQARVGKPAPSRQ